MPNTILKFKLDYSETEKISPNSGLGIYAELYKGVGLEKEIGRYFPKPGSGAGYEADEYVKSIVLMQLAGGRYLEDIRKIQSDKGLRSIANQSPIPSSDEIGDWLRRDSAKKMSGLQKINDRLS